MKPNARAKLRFKKAVTAVVTWVRFIEEVSAHRRLSIGQRESDLRTARLYLHRAEAQLKKLGIKNSK